MIQSKEISVVVQGAVDSILTPKCLKSIREQLPEAEIILSTWEGSNVEELNYDKVVFSTDPGAYVLDDVYQIKNNVNRQILSTKNGINECTRKYIVKIRSDMIILNTGFINYYDKYTKRNNECMICKQRVIINNFYCSNPHKTNFLYHVSDWFFFGLAEDVKNIWDIPLQEEPFSTRFFVNRNRPPIDPIPSWLFRYIPEQYIWISFLKKNNQNFKFDYFSDISEDNFRMSELSFANNVVIVNYEQCGIKFLKFDPYKWDTSVQYNHTDWLYLYKKYCDFSYRIPLKEKIFQSDDFKKIKKHYDKLKNKNKLLEIFSIFYYGLRLIIKIPTIIRTL